MVPGDWKLANVSPIYKGKCGSDIYIYSVANYRPITNCFIKILENIILKHLHNYLLRYNILSDDQSGFRHRDSTINQLLVIYDVIMKNLDIGKDVRFIFCDISKAFDRVWHRGLLYKLRKYGIKGNLLTWFGSYLSDRKQRVCMNGYYSTWNSINAGVPQGSILGELELEYLFFVAQSAIFFSPEIDIRLYDKNSVSHYFFFLHQNQNIFFSNIGNQNIFFRKKT